MTPMIDMPLFITPMMKPPSNSAGDLADAAHGRGAADEHGGDDVELAAEACGRHGLTEPRRDDQAAERRQHAHIGEHQQRQPRRS